MSQHPTILIGQGAFGRTVLRRLLASTAARGALVWQEAPDGSDPAARRLKNLALLGVGGRGGAGLEPGNDPEQREIFRDLERQIEEVEPSGDALASAMARAAARLLAAEDRAADPDRLRLGLDVIVLAQPAAPERVGEVLNLLAPGMNGLAGNASLARVAEGVERLSFLQILDFEQYWDPAECGRRVREAVHRAVQHWEGQLKARRPGFGRTYLVDGHTQSGFREERYRIDEIVLFLELLLFEGQRNGTMQWLYQRRRDFEPTVGTFGVRSVERSAGLLARLAAAAFGVGWLEHLAGDAGVEGDADVLELRRRLEPYRAARLRQLLAVEELEARRDEELRDLESGLLALSPDLPDWAEQVRERAESSLLTLKNHLSRWAGDRVRKLDEELLAVLPRELEAGVEAALHEGGSPATLGRVMAELDGLLREMEDLDPAPAGNAGAEADPFAPLEAAHARYREALAEQVDTDRLKRWWGFLALAVAAGWTPLLLEAIAEVPEPDAASHHLLRWGYDALQGLARPVVAGALLFAGCLAAGRLAFHRTIAQRVRRSLAFHTDPERGRLAARVRAALAPGGGLRGQVDAFAQGVERDLKARVRSDVQREVRRVRDLLAERRREALWLRDQLLDFLKGYGLDASLKGEGFERARRRRGGVRQALERSAELEDLLRKNAPRPERFRSTQARTRPFQGWAERYCGAFLHPLRFLDDLSTEYRDRGGEQATGALLAELLEFLRREGSFFLAFDWPKTEGVPVTESHALVPEAWSAFPEVMRALSDHGWSASRASRGADPGRAYLLNVRVGVSPDRLLLRQPLAAEAV
jgi:hypothetical protein